MRILLINPPCDPRTIGLRYIAKIEPLGLELIGAGVKGLHQVRLVDMEVAPQDLERELDGFKPDIVGVTSEIVHRNTAIDALARCRERYPECLTVVGGHHATMQPESFAHPAVDLIVIGEGVQTFREICDVRSRGGSDYRGVAGLAIVSGNDGIIRTSPRRLPASLDDYPVPDRSLTARYRKKYFYLFERSVAAVRTSFGCTHHCVFCSVRVYSGGRFISRSAESVFEEIRSLEEPFVMFCDDHSFIDPERMRRLAQLLIEAGVKKRYFVYARTDSIVQNRDVFELWAKAGLWLVMSGLEALDDSALKHAGKQVTAEVNAKALRIAQECGFFISAGFLVDSDFGPEDFERIDQYVKRHPSILLTEYTPLTPFPGTPLYRQVEDRLLTHEPHLFDLQHFVLPTKMPAEELYRLQLKYYGRSAVRVLRRLIRHKPSLLAPTHTAKLLRGIFRNASAYRTAHHEIAT